MRPSPFVGWNEIRREACAEASAFRDLSARMTRETNRLRALPRDRVVGACRRTVCHYYYYDNRHDLAASVAASKPYWMEGAGGRDGIERRAAPCTHPVPPLTCPRTHPAVTCLYPVYHCYQIYGRKEYKDDRRNFFFYAQNFIFARANNHSVIRIRQDLPYVSYRLHFESSGVLFAFVC